MSTTTVSFKCNKIVTTSNINNICIFISTLKLPTKITEITEKITESHDFSQECPDFLPLEELLTFVTHLKFWE